MDIYYRSAENRLERPSSPLGVLHELDCDGSRRSLWSPSACSGVSAVSLAANAPPPACYAPIRTMSAAWRYVISGLVQGVGYRYWALRRAQERGIVGFVKNLPD